MRKNDSKNVPTSGNAGNASHEIHTTCFSEKNDKRKSEKNVPICRNNVLRPKKQKKRRTVLKTCKDVQIRRGEKRSNGHCLVRKKL